MSKVYLDYAATTPMDPLVKKAMEPYFCEKFGNPSSLHSFGQEAMAAIDESRGKIAKAINADFREIIFTGSATESNNIALREITQKYTRNYAENFRVSLRKVREDLRPRLIVSIVEHESILETAQDLEKEGVEVIYLPVDKQGFVDLKKLKESLNERTILVSIMCANNEIGTIQPIAEISQIIRNFRNELRIKNYELNKKNNTHNSLFILHNSYPLFHTDAVQAFQFLNCDINKLGVDLMTLSAHKIYGPKGIGALYTRQNYELGIKNNESGNKKTIIHNSKFIIPIITGGGQEFGLRSGTENVPSIVGFAKAVELAVKNREKEFKRINELVNYFWQEIKKIYPKAEINGIQKITNYQLPITNLPNILNINFPGQKADELLMKLDLNGVAVSSGSACSARASKISHVLKAISVPENKIKSSLRFSFGKFTTKKELDETIKILKNIFFK